MNNKIYTVRCRDEWLPPNEYTIEIEAATYEEAVEIANNSWHWVLEVLREEK